MPIGDATLNVGLIGCGEIARAVHLGALSRCRGLRVAALAESDSRRRDEASRRAPGAAVFSDYRDLLDDPAVDAVVVALPTELHADAAEAAFTAGKHVYLEKPIATSLDGAGRVVEAWRASGRVGMIGFNGRFNPLFMRAAEIVRSGALGELVAARSSMSRAERPLPDWKRSRGDGGGVLLDLASHHADLVVLLFGREVREVFAETRSLLSEDDTAVVHLRLDGGLVVQSLFSLCTADEDRFEIYGRAGRLAVDRVVSFDVEVAGPVADLARSGWLKRAFSSLPPVRALVARLRSPLREPAYDGAFERFASAVRGTDDPSPDLLDGYRSLQVVLAAEESARTGRPVTIAARSHESTDRA